MSYICTSGIQCPYCENIDQSEDDFTNIDEVWECRHCEKSFDVEVEVTTRYYSTKPEDKIKNIQNCLDYWNLLEQLGCKCRDQVISNLLNQLKILQNRIAQNEEIKP